MYFSLTRRPELAIRLDCLSASAAAAATVLMTHEQTRLPDVKQERLVYFYCPFDLFYKSGTKKSAGWFQPRTAWVGGGLDESREGGGEDVS